jgi:hypothetical protein
MVWNDQYLTNVRNNNKLLTLKMQELIELYEDPPRIDPGAQQTSA